MEYQEITQKELEKLKSAKLRIIVHELQLYLKHQMDSSQMQAQIQKEIISNFANELNAQKEEIILLRHKLSAYQESEQQQQQQCTLAKPQNFIDLLSLNDHNANDPRPSEQSIQPTKHTPLSIALQSPGENLLLSSPQYQLNSCTPTAAATGISAQSRTMSNDSNNNNGIILFSGKGSLEYSQVISERMDESSICTDRESDAQSYSKSHIGPTGQKFNAQYIQQLREDLKLKSHQLMHSIQSSKFIIHPHNEPQIKASYIAESFTEANSPNSIDNLKRRSTCVDLPALSSAIESSFVSSSPSNSQENHHPNNLQNHHLSINMELQALEQSNSNHLQPTPVKFLRASNNMFLSQRRTVPNQPALMNLNSIILTDDHQSNQNGNLEQSQVIMNQFEIQPNLEQPLPQQQQQLQARQNQTVPRQIEPIGSKLFEDFFVIGPSKQALKSQLLPLESGDSPSQRFNDSGTVPPEIWAVLREENLHDAERIQQRESVKNFCYPYDVPVTRQQCLMLQQGEPEEFLNQLIFKAQTSSTDSYVIAMQGRQDYTEPISTFPETLSAANPNISLYCVCFTLENFLDDPTKETEAASTNAPSTPPGSSSSSTSTCSNDVPSVFLARATFCFLTYYPFIEFFLKMADEIASQLKKLRQLQYLSIFERNQGDQRKVMSLDLQNDMNNFWSDRMKPLRENLLALRKQAPKHGSSLSVDVTLSNPFQQQIQLKYMQSHQQQQSQQQLPQLPPEFISYTIPAKQDLHYLETEWGAGIAISALSIEDFLFVMTAVSLEERVFFFSKSLQKLTSSILTFYSLTKPFTYLFPAIFSLHMLIQGFLDTPVPILAGINKSIRYKKLLEEEGGFSFFDKVVVDLDRSAIICDNAKIKSHILEHMVMFYENQKLVDDYFIVNAKHSDSLVCLFARKRPQMVNATSESLIESFNEFHNPAGSNNSNNNNSRQQSKKRGSNSNSKGSSTRQIVELKPEQITASHRVIQRIRTLFQKSFLAHFPPREKVRKDKFNIDAISEIIVKKSGNKKKFVQKFVQTQTFITYTQDYYLGS